MAIKDNEVIVSTVILLSEREKLRIRGTERGQSVSKYVAGVVADHLASEEDAVLIVRPAREQHGSISITIPPEIVEHLDIKSGTPIIFTTTARGALIRPVR